jgi:probable lipoprotein NlpC
LRTIFTTSALFIFFVLLFASCQSSQSVFSKRGETYKSAREIAEEKRQERKERRLARKGKGSKNNVASRKRSRKEVDKDIAKVITTARSYTGTPYRWGGTTRVGMDCSGLLCTSFRSIDVNLPRTSQEQSKFGNDIRIKDLKEGDLVFFGATKNSREITHVGMVTEVVSEQEIKFIHASTTLGVIENNLFSPHYQNIFIKAIRPHTQNYTADNK